MIEMSVPNSADVSAEQAVSATPVWIKPEVVQLDLETAQQTGIPG